MQNISHISTRRGLLLGASAIGLGSALAACSSNDDPASAATTGPDGGSGGGQAPTTADEAWDRLMEGNARWAAGDPSHPGDDAELRSELAAGQSPWAIVFGCVDSRVSPQYVFDTGNGDLMTVRVAGSAFDPLVVESVAFGPLEIGTPLVVVLGHQNCGAVTLAHEVLSTGGDAGEFDQTVERLTPAYEAIQGGDDEDPVDAMIRANVALTVAELAEQPEFAEPQERGTEIVGAYYSLETGEVERL